MRKHFGMALAGICLAGGYFAGTAAAAPFSGKVVEVVRPDLVKIDSYEVRVYGADAPETGQPFAEEALAFAKTKLLGQTVTADGVATDSLGKIVAKVTLADGADYATLLVAGGYAWWDEQNAPEAKALQVANAKALLGKSGLFKDAAALTPWDFRKSHGIELYTYSTKPAEDKADPKAPKVLKLKGDMTESAPKEEAPGLPAGLEIPKEYQGLVDKHKPRFATDASGNPIGVTADNIADNPIAAALGFQNGDIATGVNGMPVRSMADIMGAVGKLNGAKNVTVTVNRGGRNIDIPINIP